MALDSGAVTESITLVAHAPTGRIVEGMEPYMSGGAGFGGALRALREARGLSLQDVADVTRIRRAYLAALEDMRLDQLPSRPFVIGYVRAYAQALGIDQDEAVCKFKENAPNACEQLRAPVGVRRHRDPRVSLAVAAAAVVVTCVLAWNLAQHAVAGDGKASPPVPLAASSAASAPTGPVALAAAQPAPPESDVPKPYITPGLATPSVAAEAAAAPAQLQRVSFSAQGAVFGAPPEQSIVTLQAHKTASIIIRGVDGTVYFARQLAAGEAYRAPASVKGLVVDVSDPQAFDIYANGALQGQLQANQTPLTKLNG
ncbi:MAG TPA: helix-turn-helix transcriptional regulator [Caulobacteraceae bacterium]|nr:helix-turn-helix transcriptional regulator [Caulobacteraceae bacterium]